jgi:hypothetical protein
MKALKACPTDLLERFQTKNQISNADIFTVRIILIYNVEKRYYDSSY